MTIIVRLVLGIALAVAVVILAVAVVKLVVVLALLGAVGLGALYAYHFVRAFARRLAARRAAAPPAMLLR